MPFPGGTGSRIAAVQWASAEHPEQAKDFGDTLQDVFLATTQEKMPALQQFFLYTISLMATKTGLLVIREETEELKNAAEAAEGSLEEHGKSVELLKLLDVKEREF